MGIRRVIYNKKIHHELIVEDELLTETDLNNLENK